MTIVDTINDAVTVYNKALTNYQTALKNYNTALSVNATGTSGYTGSSFNYMANGLAGTPGTAVTKGSANDCFLGCTETNAYGTSGACVQASWNNDLTSSAKCSYYSSLTGASTIAGMGNWPNEFNTDTNSNHSIFISKNGLSSHYSQEVTDAYKKLTIAVGVINSFTSNPDNISAVNALLKAQGSSLAQMNTQYKKMQKDRSEIADTYNLYTNTGGQFKDTTIESNQHVYQYLLWVIITIIVITMTTLQFTNPNINIVTKFPIISVLLALMVIYFIYDYFQQIHITHPNVDLAYNVNKINYFNY